MPLAIHPHLEQFPCPGPKSQALNNLLDLPKMSAQMSPPLGSLPRCLDCLVFLLFDLSTWSSSLSVLPTLVICTFPYLPLNGEACEGRSWASLSLLCPSTAQHRAQHRGATNNHLLIHSRFYKNLSLLGEDRCSNKKCSRQHYSE